MIEDFQNLINKIDSVYQVFPKCKFKRLSISVERNSKKPFYFLQKDSTNIMIINNDGGGAGGQKILQNFMKMISAG